MSARILLVDDEPELLEELASFLARRGYEVVRAGNGREALAVLETAELDLVVTDDIMPEATGRGLIAAMRAADRLRRMPVILISALQTAEGAVMPADIYLHKPFRLAELAKAVQSLLARSAGG